MSTTMEYGGKTFQLEPEIDRAERCKGCAFVQDADGCSEAGWTCTKRPGGIWVETGQLAPPAELLDVNTLVHDGLTATTLTSHASVPASKPMILPADPQVRKNMPITSGVLDYFPLALAEVAKCSKAGNDQHNPGQPLHWDKTKSTDHADCIARHLIDRGCFDTDGIRHSAKLAWRALANLQIELQAELEATA